MERNGMYENTPWERLAEYGIWVGLATLALALIVYVVRHKDRNLFNSAIPAAKAVFIMGIVFNYWWVEAHANYPYPFGRIMLGVGCGIALLGLIVGLIKRPWLAASIRFAALLAPSVAAIYISSTSTSIIAEGQVTAMVLPYVMVIGLVLASIITSFFTNPQRWAPAVLLLGFTYAINYFLPVVQFRADNSVYPVTAPAIAALAGAIATEFWMMARNNPIVAKITAAVVTSAAIYFAFTLQHIYGIALAGVGAAMWLTLDAAIKKNIFSHYDI